MGTLLWRVPVLIHLHLERRGCDGVHPGPPPTRVHLFTSGDVSADDSLPLPPRVDDLRALARADVRLG